MEALPQPSAVPAPVLLEVGVPRHQRAVVIHTKSLKVLDDELSVDRSGQLGNRRHHAAGKDVLVDPLIDMDARAIAPDRV